MRRIQFIELHEQSWFPSSLRDFVTDALQFGFNLLKLYAPIAPLLQSVLDSTGSRMAAGQSVVDLGSGGGGPWLDLSRKLHGNPPGLRIWLTDKYPNLGAFQKVRAASENQITFYPDSVEAMNVPRELKGLRTMFTSFHHFAPDEARAILQNAVDAGEAVGIFEIARRAWSTIGLTFAFVLMLFVCTPLIRPFRWSRLLWTYLVPIIPVVLLFDGVVSCLRTYRPHELREMVEKLSPSKYRWEIGEHSKSLGEAPITYLIGYKQAGGSMSDESPRPSEP
ncbi:MAG: hypothetical protein ABSA54_11805 [Terriglobales bacterium]|jgi:hypothetical protein